jgi:hypothetical protein
MTVKETPFSDFKVNSQRLGAVWFVMVISESDPTAYFSEKVYDRHFLRRNDTNLNVDNN